MRKVDLCGCSESDAYREALEVLATWTCCPDAEGSDHADYCARCFASRALNSVRPAGPEEK
jgi:hypothetical protein